MSGLSLSGATLTDVRGQISAAPTALPTGYVLIDSRIVGARVDLSGVNFTSVDLSGLDFSGINLSGGKLIAVNLSGTDFSGANLTGVRGFVISGVPAALPTGYGLVYPVSRSLTLG